MRHVIITISNVNHYNFQAMHDVVGEAGYAGCLKGIDMCTYTLDIGSEEHRKQCGILDDEISMMVGKLLCEAGVFVQFRTVASEVPQ